MAPLLPLLFALSAAAAEPVTLVFPSGGRLSGVLLEDSGGVYVLERDGGQLEFPHEAVARVLHEPNPEAAARARESALPAGDAAGLWALARYCADNGLTARARRTAERVLTLEPTHAEARAFLGYELVFGQWLRGEELTRAKGWVRHEGKWMTLAQRRRLLEEESEAAPRPPPPVYDGLAAAINSLARRLAEPRQPDVTRMVYFDGGAFARANARHARRRLGRRDEDEEQGAQPWRPVPFSPGYSVLGIPPMDPVGSRFGF
ncbi:hypothetical protein EPO15_07770 [bacterium]|nr:MAG: hypothetical protein EPO15_07770 [bacterium]